MNEYYVHNIDPYMIKFPFELGIIKGIPWYGFSYLLGFIVGLYLLERLRKESFFPLSSKKETEIFVYNYVVFAVLIGGRLGHVLFYEPSIITNNFLDVFKVWQGGMASHGGILGVILGIYLFSRKYKYSFWRLLDCGAIAATPGLAFGRIANFINAEMPGKVTDVPWAVVFPKTDDLPRHPSQLYQSLGEGVFLFLVLWFIVPRNKFKEGFHVSLFIVLYGVQRIVTEFFRESSDTLASTISFLTQGQVLSIIMILIGLFMLYKTQINDKNLEKTA
jgi:phosphatidylglycerol---prolipoprotein diacylglyceryl transferase